MNFHETKMGSIFFNSQLPQLTRALQEIASALSKPKPVPAVKLEDTADPDFLHDLLYCMYEIEVFGNRAQFSSLDADVRQAEAAVLAVPGQSRELFEQYQQATARRNDAEIERAFCSGYRAGVHAVLSGISAPQAATQGGAQDGQ